MSKVKLEKNLDTEESWPWIYKKVEPATFQLLFDKTTSKTRKKSKNNQYNCGQNWGKWGWKLEINSILTTKVNAIDTNSIEKKYHSLDCNINQITYWNYNQNGHYTHKCS